MFKLTSASTCFMAPKAQLMKAKTVDTRMVAIVCFLQVILRRHCTNFQSLEKHHFYARGGAFLFLRFQHNKYRNMRDSIDCEDSRSLIAHSTRALTHADHFYAYVLIYDSPLPLASKGTCLFICFCDCFREDVAKCGSARFAHSSALIYAEHLTREYIRTVCFSGSETSTCRYVLTVLARGV
jgi:hypothetical protein